MARQVNPTEHAARRREILDAALQLMHDKGYDAMTIEDLLAELQISKGALYHYFRSKRALLEGVIEQMGEIATARLAGIVDDPHRGALDKLHAYFDASRAWKSESVTEVATLIRLWHDENNALLRQKMTQGSMRTTAPLLESIIRQGCAEGVFDTDYPHEAAGIITAMGLHLADAFIDAIEADGAVGSDISGPNAQKVVGAYVQAFERILGAPPGSLHEQESSAQRES
ncbi:MULTISPECIES: TetR/AcrR family transcriptional regulator [unclassified Mycolicibacterium]|uniref:TetR/AcrR family transcriptional regulator n=1 Tax=unclassified Mycolicibacterium TaxID=2636767 RepID=UPI0012DF50B9|nr:MULTISPECIES: TetR/AcrR family transcriptional regulator [unclassified Mycolicibacterium]MUL82498.1 TetR/AcrR family transcriptional regulator [Mycolicibacterium sp. CBMA 329]MUL91370.1 TetR/AcrR family transcriptional regulator [Mycolicibacterium sp. CBMA 331]MUM01493.1 TetR/AcrR family transcriptional regulator [Mycolicibacterium sp. CBMA 334]MUM27420.1 TetR/AcrR family transcriptional regulator [Mycolicibacterium sp. CBMA 295]MUM41794.1 TetR/AcrR family transcriptional regulator [Mycolic